MIKIIRLLLFFTFLLLSKISLNQTLYRFDYVETFDNDWSGNWWTPAPTTNYYTNASVSPSASAVIYGSGSGTSGIESDWYSFPNLVVNPDNQYYFTFRLASYRFTSTNSTRGVDGPDYITVQLSVDGGITYTNEIRITGTSNAFWNYNTNATFTKTANGTLATLSPVAGGDRTNTGDGYSVIRLNIPPNTSNIAIDIFARVNSAGEEWWFDNFELHEVVNFPLPVELLYFYGFKKDNYNFLTWATNSEHNSYYFEILHSIDGENWEDVKTVKAGGNSNQKIEYNCIHIIKNNLINYYCLKQVDTDGKFKIYDIIAIDNRYSILKIIKCINTLGQEVDINTKGIVIVIYENGDMKKIFNN